MLRRLTVKNYAIVRDIESEFDDGLSILSGETGAGKSIIVGALNLILGERASSEAVRSGENLAVVEAEIDDIPKSALNELRLNDIDVDGTSITVRREVQARGASRAFINDRMISVSALKGVASSMFDLVGQHQQQYLINVDHHIRFLDSFANLGKLASEVAEAFDRFSQLRADLDRFRNDSLRRQEMMELYRFQVKEIEQAGLSTEEEDQLASERKILENAERLRTTLGGIADAVVEQDDSLTSRLAGIEKSLEEAAEIDKSLSETLESIRSARFVLEDAGRSLASRAGSVEADPNRLTEIEIRLDVYYELKHKYGGSIQALEEYYNKAKVELDTDVDLTEQIRRTADELNSAERKLSELAVRLSERRHEQSLQLSKKVEKELSQLGISKGQFEVRISRRESADGLVEIDGSRFEVTRDGVDEVEFFFCANRGEELRPLAKIASGGELSRVMLALKTVGATRQKLETLIFDEVDSGIGGEVAAAVGRKLRQLARKHQIIVITHLQQIAAAGSSHYRVYKEKSDGRMVTRIKKLSDSERREEIGRMLSGDKLTDTSLKQAEELLNEFE